MAQILFKEFLLIRLFYTYFLVDIGPLVGGAVQQSFNDKAGVDDAFDQLLALDPRKFDFMKQKQRCPCCTPRVVAIMYIISFFFRKRVTLGCAGVLE